jgi:transcriptional antiterminator NusG
MARWYIIHAYSGFENKVRDSVIAEAERMGLSQLVESVEVPVETVTEVKRGKKVQAERKFFPGYVLAKLTMTDDVYHLVKNTPKVTGFLGSMGKPQAISEAEAARILNSKEEAAARPKTEIRVDYEIGDQVKVLEGPFASFNGLVEELDFDKARVKVSVSIFGRATPVELAGRWLEGDRPASRGRPARARAYTIPKSPEGQTRKADAGQSR